MSDRVGRRSGRGLFFLLCVGAACAAGAPCASGQAEPKWRSHDLDRPRPSVVAPAPAAAPVPPPADAVVLFDGGDLSEWRGEEGGPATWIVRDGAMMPPGKGEDIFTVRAFGDVQLHIEWASPQPPQGSGQGRGNSGVFFMGQYEIQILDSFENDTYADGQAGAVYGQHPPLVNACRAPGEWQTFDIVFRRPRFVPGGALASPSRATVFHNGIVVQDGAEFLGPTMWLQHQPYDLHPDRLPLSLQDHGNPVRFRNIWVRELRETAEPGPAPAEAEPAIHLSPEELGRCTGVFKTRPEAKSGFDFRSDGKQLYCIFGEKLARVDLVPHSEHRFSMRWAAAHVEFELPEAGPAAAVTFHVGRDSFTAQRTQ